MGDAQTRSDIEMAAAAGVIDNITTQGPQSWTSLLGNLKDNDGELPPGVRDAADRLTKLGTAQLDLHRPHVSVSLDAASDPATVRGYDGLGRAEFQGQAIYEYLATSTAVRLAVGSQTTRGRDRQRLVLDGSYIAQRLDSIILYAGYKEHWWGPGWISTLSLSTNARPMPQIGLTRVDSRQSETWLLSWLGPWQVEGFVGLLDDPRVAKNTGFVGLHFAFNPLPGLEIGLSRTTELCGSGHRCRPLVDYFTFSNDEKRVNATNEQGSIELRYTGMADKLPYAVYAQFMNEDTNPLVHSTTSRLFGGTIWLPYEDLTGRLTLEYASSIPTQNIWGGPIQHGAAYNNYDYIDGMRYRGRALGFSLDSDSVLYSVQAGVIDSGHRTWTLTYHRALVSTPQNNAGNVVTIAPTRFNGVEARFATPVEWGDWRVRAEVAGRLQDDRARPGHGAEAALEFAVKFGM